MGYNVECNLKPTVQCLRELGLADTQIARAVTGDPSFLGFSVATAGAEVPCHEAGFGRSSPGSCTSGAVCAGFFRRTVRMKALKAA